MSGLAFLDEITTDDGLVDADRLTDLLHITRSELAIALGLSRGAVSKSARVGSPQQAFAWYRSQTLPALGDQTAEALVKEGRAEDVKRHLDRITMGGYA